jgi:IS605 OrfB family transposase
MSRQSSRGKELRGVQQNLLSVDRDTAEIIKYLCQQSNSLYNCGTYWARQVFFKTERTVSKFDVIYECGKNIHAQALPSTPAQQTLLSVSEAFKSFKQLRNKFESGELNFRPKPPKYRVSGGLFKVAYPNTGAQRPKLSQDGKTLTFSLGNTVNRWFGVKSFDLPMPDNLDYSKVKEFTILPKNGAFYLEASYEIEKETHFLDANKALGIDLGCASNLLACVDTKGNSFLVDSRQAKAMNQLYNKRIAQRKKGKSQDYWDVVCDAITRKRNNQMRDLVNKAAKLAVNHCIKHGLGTLVIGWNQGIKTESDMGKRENQKFVQMPLAKLKSRISQLCEKHGIRFVETEEANTSAASYLDGDSLPEHGLKPDGWKASGRRSPRGLYKTADKSKVNADLQAAANILRKVAGNLGIDLSRLGRRSLTTAGRIRLWMTPQSNTCPKESQWLQP